MSRKFILQQFYNLERIKITISTTKLSCWVLVWRTLCGNVFKLPCSFSVALGSTSTEIAGPDYLDHNCLNMMYIENNTMLEQELFLPISSAYLPTQSWYLSVCLIYLYLCCFPIHFVHISDNCNNILPRVCGIWAKRWFWTLPILLDNLQKNHSCSFFPNL